MTRYRIVTQSWSALNLDNDAEGSADEAIKRAEFYAENDGNTNNSIDVKTLKNRSHITKKEFDSI